MHRPRHRAEAVEGDLPVHQLEAAAAVEVVPRGDLGGGDWGWGLGGVGETPGRKSPRPGVTKTWAENNLYLEQALAKEGPLREKAGSFTR